MLSDFETLHSFWFLFGLSVGVVVTSILLVTLTFLDYKPITQRHKKELEEAKKEGYSLGRDWDIGEKLYLEMEIDNLWYEVEELKSKFEKLPLPKYDGLFADDRRL